MAIPQFEKTQPILEVQKVNSRASGFESFAKAFGDTADAAENKIVSVEKEKSNAMFMLGANQAEKLKTDTQIQMIQDPNNAATIAKNAALTSDTIKNSAVVNKEDRQRLEYMINNNMNAINVKAAETGMSQAKRGVALTFWNSYPTTSRQIEEALNRGDFKTAKDLTESLHESGLGAATIGAITPEQFGTVNKTTGLLYDRSIALHDRLLGSEGMSAKEYHTAYTSPFGSSAFSGGAQQPSDGHTQWMTGHLNNDRTMAGQFSALYSDQPINYGVVAGSTEAEYNKFLMQSDGVQRVKGAIKAATPFNQIQAHIDTLESKPTDTQREDEKAEINYWKGFQNRYKTDNGFYATVGATAPGIAFTADHDAQGAAIMASGKSGAALNAALQANDNKYIGEMVDLGFSLEINKTTHAHMDPNAIKPIPVAWSEKVKSAFQKDAPVLPAIQQLAYVNPEFRPYMAETMKHPNQATAIFIAGATLEKADPSFAADLIHANQDKTDAIGAEPKKGASGEGSGKGKSSLITSEKAGTGDNAIWNNVLNADPGMKTLYAYFGMLPRGGAAQDGFKTMALNYVHDQAKRSGDADITNVDKYVGTLVKNTLKGFNFYRTDNAFINLNDIPVTQTQDASYLTSYGLSQAYQKIHEGMSEAEFHHTIDLNPLMIVSTPDRRLVAVDSSGRAAMTADGHEAFDVPYTSNMLAAAQKNSKEIGSFLSNYGFKQQPDDEFIPATYVDVALHTAERKRQAEMAKNNEAAVAKVAPPETKAVKEERFNGGTAQSENAPIDNRFSGGTAKAAKEERFQGGTAQSESIAAKKQQSASKSDTISPQNVDDEGRDFIRHRESKNGKPDLKAYLDSSGHWTIGYGHTEGVKEGQTITKDQAEKFLDKDLAPKIAAVKSAIKVPLNSNQLHALASIAFNTGETGFKTSILAKKINSGASEKEIKEAFRMWNKETKNRKKVFSQGLANRREDEIKLYFKKGKS